MAYQEGLLEQQMAIAAVASGLTRGVTIASSFGVDLNPDFGKGISPRKSPFLGQTGKLMIRVDVTVDWLTGAGAPHLQFHAIASKFNQFLHSTSEYVFVGSNVGPPVNVSSRLLNGFKATELTVGQSFWIRINPWNDRMGRTLVDTVITAGSFVVAQEYRVETLGTTDWYAIGGEPVVGSRFVATGVGAGTGTAQEVTPVQDFRYLGLAVTVPEAEGNVGLDPYFAQGTVNGVFVYDSQPDFEPQDMIYPSGVVIK